MNEFANVSPIFYRLYILTLPKYDICPNFLGVHFFHRICTILSWLFRTPVGYFNISDQTSLLHIFHYPLFVPLHAAATLTSLAVILKDITANSAFPFDSDPIATNSGSFASMFIYLAPYGKKIILADSTL